MDQKSYCSVCQAVYCLDCWKVEEKGAKVCLLCSETKRDIVKSASEKQGDFACDLCKTDQCTDCGVCEPCDQRNHMFEDGTQPEESVYELLKLE